MDNINTFIEIYLTHHTVCLSEIHNSVLFDLLAHCPNHPTVTIRAFHRPPNHSHLQRPPGSAAPPVSGSQPRLKAAVRPGPPPLRRVSWSQPLSVPGHRVPQELEWGCWPGPVNRSLGGKPCWLPHGLFTQQLLTKRPAWGPCLLPLLRTL